MEEQGGNRRGGGWRSKGGAWAHGYIDSSLSEPPAPPLHSGIGGTDLVAQNKNGKPRLQLSQTHAEEYLGLSTGPD